jgi:hypothetical protein
VLPLSLSRHVETGRAHHQDALVGIYFTVYSLPLKATLAPSLSGTRIPALKSCFAKSDLHAFINTFMVDPGRIELPSTAPSLRRNYNNSLIENQ